MMTSANMTMARMSQIGSRKVLRVGVGVGLVMFNLSLAKRAEKDKNHDDDKNRDEPTAHIRSLRPLVIFQPFFLHAALFVGNIM